MAKTKQTNDFRGVIQSSRLGWRQDPVKIRDHLTRAGVQSAQITGKSRITMCCPFHQDSHPSAHIYLDHLKFRCYAATCNTTILDPIMFWQRLLGISYLDAVDVYKREYENVSFLKTETSKYLTQAYFEEKCLRLWSELLHEYMMSIWEDNSIPETTKAARHWLKVVREIDDPSLIDSLGMFPRLSYVKANWKGDVPELDWILKYLGNYLDNKYVDNITFTYATSSTHITGFKLRKPGIGIPHAEAITFIRNNKDEPIGFFGLTNSGYKSILHNEQFKQAIVVEGEFDQLAFYKNQAKQQVFNEVVVCLSGGGHSGADALSENGLTKVSIIGDDDAGGLGFCKGVLEKSSSDIAFKLFKWDDKLRIQGVALDPDDAIKRYTYSKMYKIFSDEKNYKYPPAWCKELIDQELEHVSADDVRTQEEVIAKYGYYIKAAVEIDTFADLMKADYPALTLSSIVKAVRNTDNTDLGFIHRITAWLRKKMIVVYYDNNDNVLCLFHRAKRVQIRVSMRNRQAAYSAFFQQIQGITIFEWARDEVGLPDYYPSIDVGEDGERPGTKFVQGQIESWLYEAFGLLVGEAVRRPGALLSQGIHLDGISDAGTPGYVVNGDRVYKLLWNADGQRLIEVQELSGPVDGAIVFDLERREQLSTDRHGAWLPQIKNKDDFFTKPKYNIKECYAYLLDIIHTCWEFKYQTNDVEYVALLILYGVISNSMQRKVMTHFYGEFESGKSSILALVANGQQLPGYQLNPHASTADNYTLASIYQGFAGTTLTMGLDEANDTGDEHHNVIRKIFENVRGLATKGYADRMIGTQSQQVRAQYLCNSLITASGTEIHNDMDASRINTLTLIKNPNKANTRVVLTKKYGLEFFEDLRTSIVLNMINIAPAIARIYVELPVEFNAASQHKHDRMLDGLLPLASISKYVEADYQTFLVNFTTNRKEDVELRQVTRDGQSILDKIMNIPKVNILFPGTDAPREITIRTALRTLGTREAINQSECGVYYDERERAIGIAWEHARMSLLQYDKSLRLTAKDLKNAAPTTPYWISDKQAKSSGLYTRLHSIGLAGATVFSFFSVAKYVSDIEAAIKASAEIERTDAERMSVDISKFSKGDKDGTGGMNL